MSLRDSFTVMLLCWLPAFQVAPSGPVDLTPATGPVPANCCIACAELRERWGRKN